MVYLWSWKCSITSPGEPGELALAVTELHGLFVFCHSVLQFNFDLMKIRKIKILGHRAVGKKTVVKTLKQTKYLEIIIKRLISKIWQRVVFQCGEHFLCYTKLQTKLPLCETQSTHLQINQSDIYTQHSQDSYMPNDNFKTCKIMRIVMTRAQLHSCHIPLSFWA